MPGCWRIWGLPACHWSGLGFGGWIAAEMASQAPQAFKKLILVGAMGIKPPEGDIADQAIVSYLDYPRSGFHDQAAFAAVYGDVTTDQLEAWDIAREMSFRTAWKPYMYSQTLPHLLGGVRSPALIIWGDDDRIVPLSAGQAYARALPGATHDDHSGLRTFRRNGKTRRRRQTGDRFPVAELKEASVMHMMYFTEQPMACLRRQGRTGLWRDRAELLQQVL